MSGGLPDDGIPVSGLLAKTDQDINDWTRWHWGKVLYRDDWPFG